EIMGQAGKTPREQARVFQLARQELDGVGQAGRGQDFLMQALQDLLRRQVGRETLAQDAEQVRLFNVFFGVQDIGGDHGGMITCSDHESQFIKRLAAWVCESPEWPEWAAAAP